MSSTTQGQGKTGVATAKTTEKEKITGKCAYTGCPAKDNEESETFATLKNTDYKFHMDCLDNWQAESRNAGKFSIEDRIAVLDEQSGKNKKTAGETKK